MADLRYDVELAGRGFVVSRKGGRFGRRSIPVQKAQQDTSELPGEQSLNPEDLWRRSFESWHRGAGQEYFDWGEGDEFRFRSSWGVDPWSTKRLQLLSETETKLASTASSVKLVVAGGYLYVADGQTLKFTQDILTAGVSTWTTVTGTPPADITAITSDGYRVWIGFGTSGVYHTTRGETSAQLYAAVAASTLGHVKGRLLVGYANEIVNVTQYQVAYPVIAVGGEADSAGGNDTSLVVTLPPSSSGDVFLVAIGWSADDAEDQSYVPDGWTVLHRGSARDGSATEGISSRIFAKVSAGESSVTVSIPQGAQTWAATALTYRDAYIGGTATEDAVESTVAAASFVAPSVTSLAPIGTLISALFTQNNVPLTFTIPASMDLGGNHESVTPHIHVATAEQFLTAPGATGTRTWATSANADDSVVVNLVLPGARADSLFTHPSTDFTWVGFAEGQGDIYAAGYSGDKSLIYRTQIRADGTALDAPVVAATLPDGEVVRSIHGYLGLLFIGTDAGVRMAVSDANGDLTIGALIETASSVRCFEGQGRYVWFGLEDFDVSRWASGTQDGLGRLDLTQQVEQLVPAWASDLMAAASTSTTETVQSVATFQGRRVFSVASSNGLTRGVYAEKANKVTDGYLDSGYITYGISDTKVATYVDVLHKTLVGTVQVYVSTDDGAFVSAGSSSDAGTTRPAAAFSAGPSRGEFHELRVRLERAASADAVGPQVTRLTLRSEPAPSRGRVMQWPLVLAKKLRVGGREVTRDPAADIAYVEGLFASQTLIECREDALTFSAFVKDYEFVAEHRTDDGRVEQGILTVTLKAPGQ